MMRKIISTLLVALAFMLSATAQDQTITGEVTDSKGIPISDVSVLGKGTNVGTTTNPAGMYSINIPSDCSSNTLNSSRLIRGINIFVALFRIKIFN